MQRGETCVADPDFAALSGTTLYGTSLVPCSSESAEEGGSWLIAVDTASGKRTQIADYGCSEPKGIAVAPDGTLLMAMSDDKPEIDRVNPANGALATASKGGSLTDPGGIALTPSGDLVVADAAGSVIGISTQTGRQTTIASGPDLTGANGIAVDASGKIYVTADGPSPVLKASAARRQRVSSAGIRLRVSCLPRCTIAYSYSSSGVEPSFDGNFEAAGVSASRSLRVKLGAELNRYIKRALRRNKTVRLKLTLTAKDPRTDASGNSKTVTVRLVR